MTSTHQRSSQKHRSDQIAFWKDTSGVSATAFVLSSVVLICGLFLGGGGGWFGDTAVQLLALPLIVLSAMEWSRHRLQTTDWAALALIAGIVLLGCFQLMPLSPTAWAALPARADLLTSAHLVGTAPAWYSISLNPWATEQALVWTLPAVAMMLAVRWMSDRQRQVLLTTLFVSILLLIIVGVLNNTASQSDDLATANEAIAKANLALNSALNADSSRPALAQQSEFGVFSNRNHFGTLLAMTVPLVVALGLLAWRRSKESSSGAWMPLASAMALILCGLLVGMIQTHSRAALGMGILALMGSLLLLRHMGIPRKIIWSIAIGAAVMFALVIQMAGSKTVAHFDTSVGTDLRWQMHATTLQAARHFGPLGSGLGTFVQAYQQVPPVEGFLPAYVNRAHGDYHELWLEAGIPGMVIVLCFVGWFGWSTWLVWRTSVKRVPNILIARAASLSLLVLLLHSYVEYPLRKTAILAMFGLACALLAPTSAVTKTSPENASTRGLRRTSLGQPNAG